MPHDDSMFMDFSTSALEAHAYYEVSVHRRVPTPSVVTRSYTLEGAITPLSPELQQHLALAPSTPAARRETESPPRVGTVLPPTSLLSHPSLSPTSFRFPTASGPSALVQSSPPAVHLSLAQQSFQKHPRGRPRKNRPPRRAGYVGLTVDYPFPQLTTPGSGGKLAKGFDGAVPSASTSLSPPPPTVMTVSQAMFQLNLALGDGDGKGPEKKPIMACLFCRERKIACGPPVPGGPRRCK